MHGQLAGAGRRGAPGAVRSGTSARRCPSTARRRAYTRRCRPRSRRPSVVAVARPGRRAPRALFDWHVCAPLPEHCWAPGVHTPVHDPPTHAWLLHVPGAFCQGPRSGAARLRLLSAALDLAGRAHALARPGHASSLVRASRCRWSARGARALSQVCGCWPLHCALPGAHEPAHTPFTHAWLVQAVGVPQVPEVPHVSVLLPEHWTLPGVQVPVQAPLTHACPLHDTAEPH